MDMSSIMLDQMSLQLILFCVNDTYFYFVLFCQFRKDLFGEHQIFY